MAKDTSVQELIINKLTKAQYDAALSSGTINENELYMRYNIVLKDLTGVELKKRCLKLI